MKRDWASFPEELLSLILSKKLFAKDRLSFSLVCKAWNKAAKLSPYGHSPCLMYYQRNNRALKLFQYNGFVTLDLPEKHLAGADIRCAKHGWMLMMTQPPTATFFYDPFNNETIHLPKPDYRYPVVCFFHPPTSRDCFVVGAQYVGECDMLIGVLRRGENKWTSCVYHGKSPFRLSPCTPVLHQQGLIIHFLDLDGNVGMFDVARSGSPDSWTVLTECLPAAAALNVVQHFLVELRDKQMLVSVLVAHEERKVGVFGMLLSAPGKWVPVEDLGDKALFVSRRACFAVTAPWRSMANRIYFAKLHGDEDVVFYCLGTRRYHSCKGDYSSKDSFRFKDLSFATWITATTTPVFPRDLTWCTTTTAL